MFEFGMSVTKLRCVTIILQKIYFKASTKLRCHHNFDKPIVIPNMSLVHILNQEYISPPIKFFSYALVRNQIFDHILKRSKSLINLTNPLLMLKIHFNDTSLSLIFIFYNKEEC